MGHERIVGCGMSGLVGRPLSRLLHLKYELVRLKRTFASKTGPADCAREVFWDPEDPKGEWVKEIDGAFAAINLCGESIADRRWTASQKAKLRASRIVTTRAVVDAISRAAVRPKVLLNASAIGYYGDRGNDAVDENSSGGHGFLADLCEEWEKEALRAESFGVRVVLLRTGIVLARGGGALAKMLPPFRFFIGGPLGAGRQVMSWIHLEDEVRAIEFALEKPALKGPVNLTAPNPASMNEFAAALGKRLHKPSFFRVPGFALKILLGEMSEMLLGGQRVLPKKLEDAGFHFRFPRLDDALKDLVR